ncbi:MAG: hypothetical protein KatS3mg068_1557 [Candidatus Sericytochromatia bacterium]|nr:MAG: hypothetical protein KatS3mg068_1557 [Candidatus Sericytochromatia bacterium]
MSSLTINKSSISDLLEILKKVSANTQRDYTFFKIENNNILIRSISNPMVFKYTLKEDLGIKASLDLFDFIKFLEMSIIYDNIEIKDSKNTILIKTEKNKIKLSKKEEYDFSDIDDLLDRKEYAGTIRLEDIDGILSICRNFNYGKSKDRSLSDRVRFDKGDCVATDGAFMLIFPIQFESSINLNVSDLPKILKVFQDINDNINIYKVDNWNIFESGNIYYFTPQMEDSFPNYKSVFPDIKEYNSITINRNIFRDIIKEIDSMMWVGLKTENNDLVIYYVEDNRIEIENRIELLQKNGVDINIKMNPRKLYSILEFLDNDSVNIFYNPSNPSKSPVFIKDESSRNCLIMCLSM